jgi:DNA polymerase-4
MSMQILHIDLDAFLVSVERKHDPSLCGRPIVIGGQPTGWGRVVAASSEAAACGVKAGLSLSIAASRCPKAVFLDGAFDRYLDASAAVDEIVREPGVPVEWASIDSLFLDLTKAPAALGPARRIAERLQTAIRERLGFEVACGLAGTKVAAQVASRLARPRGLLYVLPGYEERFLAALDINILPDLPPGAVARLRQSGVLTIGALAAMDVVAADLALGRRSRELMQFARGRDERHVDGAAPPRSLARDMALPRPTQDAGQLESSVQYLTETLATRLRHTSCFAQTVTVRVRGGAPERTMARSMTLREASAADADLVSAAHAVLHLLRRSCPVVSGVSVVLSNLHHGGAQMPLFPLAPPAAASSQPWTSVRGRGSFRAMVNGRFLDAGRFRRTG